MPGYGAEVHEEREVGHIMALGQVPRTTGVGGYETSGWSRTLIVALGEGGVN